MHGRFITQQRNGSERSTKMVQIDISMPRCCSACPLMVSVGFDAYCRLTCYGIEPEIFDRGRRKDCPMKEVEDETQNKH